jgi:GT2 family glycosyltransferase
MTPGTIALEPGVEPRPRLDDLTVVIPTLGREILRECLASILAGSHWPGCVVVVDQGSSDKVAEMVAELRSRGLPAEHVPSDQRGRASAVNRGIERAESRFVAVTDDDCLVAPDWALKMVHHLRRDPGWIVTGRVDPAGEEAVLAVTTSERPAIHRRPRLKHDSMSGGNMGAEREVLVSLGLFDEDPRLRTAEDCELSYRALTSGVAIRYTPDVVVGHLGWRGAEDRVAQYRSYAMSLGGFYGKYLRRGDPFIALRVLVHHARSARRWIHGALTGDEERAENGWAYLTCTWRGIVSGWRRS